MDKDESFLADITLSPSILGTTSTPKTSRRGRNVFKKPNVPAAKSRSQGPILAKCAKCNKEYRTLSYYKKHMQTHALIEATSKIPNVSDLLDKSIEIARRVLNHLRENPCVGKYAAEYNQFVLLLLECDECTEWKCFVNFVCGKFTNLLNGKTVTLPSAMINVCLGIVEQILSDLHVRGKCMDLLMALSCSQFQDMAVKNIFMCNFVFRFCDEFLITMSRLIREAGRQEEVNVQIDANERKAIHNIAGSVVKGFCRYGRRYPGNSKWRSILTAITSKMIENPEIAPASQSDRSWTQIQNRKALTFVGADALEFFVSLAKVLHCMEFKHQRALPHDEIMEAVFSGECKFIWDAMIGSSLTEELSISLLKGVSRSFTHTYGRGICLKKMNTAAKSKPFTSITLRHSVAPKKSN